MDYSQLVDKNLQEADESLREEDSVHSDSYEESIQARKVPVNRNARAFR